jgi:CheY-like chemotaxis protein
VADNGLDAFEQVKANPKDYFSAIILDINMPIMDGLEACLLTHNYLEGNVPIFALSTDVENMGQETLQKYPFA